MFRSPCQFRSAPAARVRGQRQCGTRWRGRLVVEQMSITLPDSSIAWKTSQTRDLTSDVPTPLFYDGDFFVLSDVRKKLSRVNPSSGQIKWTVDMPGSRKFESSPTGADGKIYCMNFAGDVTVVDAAKGQVLGTIAMGEEGDDMTRSEVAVAGGQLFIRTNHKLFCIAGK